MAVSTQIKIILIRFASMFCCSKKSKAIFYHDIHSDQRFTNMSTSVELFKKHIQIIRESGHEIVSKISKETGQIEISFDDAYLGLYCNFNVIKELDIPIQLFVVSSFLEKDNHINKTQLLELNKSDLITISSHTNSHKILSEIDAETCRFELTESKKGLEELLDTEVNSLCFPEGKFNNQTIKIANEVGYEKKYSSLPGFYFDEFTQGVKKRSLVQFAREKEFKAILKGGDHILSLWYKLKHFK